MAWTTQMNREPQAEVSCQNCEACCCRLEVMLFTDTGVPDRYVDEIEGQVPVMHRLEDGWCAALDRNTMMCRIYEVRPLICREFEMGEPDCVDDYEVRPLICREFEMGEPDCVDERDKWFINLS